MKKRIFQIKYISWFPGCKGGGIEEIVNEWLWSQSDIYVRSVTVTEDSEFYKGTLYNALIVYKCDQDHAEEE